MRRLAKVFLLLFILTSGYTLGFGYADHPILGRVNPPDIFAALGIICTLCAGISIQLDQVARGYLFVLLAFAPGIIISENSAVTLSEMLALTFLAMFYIAASNLFTGRDLHLVLVTLSIGALVPAVIGLVDITTPILAGVPLGTGSGLMRSSTFRNGGQAGEFMLVVLALLIPLRISGVFSTATLLQKRIYESSLLFSFLFFLLTIKVASYIGLGFGLMLLAFYTRRVGPFVIVGSVGTITYFLWGFFTSQYSDLASWMTSRVQNRLGSWGAFSPGGFIYENFSAAFRAFMDNPLFGSGIGGIWRVYHENEIHSTYVKIIGETGLVGSMAYITLMFACWRLINMNPVLQRNRYYNYLHLFTPMILGCAVSWVYTYHLRKREFAVMLLILLLVRRNAVACGAGSSDTIR